MEGLLKYVPGGCNDYYWIYNDYFKNYKKDQIIPDEFEKTQKCFDFFNNLVLPSLSLTNTF
jgi:hypothetical protein